MHCDEDFALALQLQEEFVNEVNSNDLKPESTINSRIYKMMAVKDKENDYKKKSHKEASIVDASWEYIDPTPDIHGLFIQFDNRFFWGKLKTVEVRWSPRMTLCAGICCYEGRGGLCSVRLSVPLLKLRPRKDLVETLLHEMIHAYLFVTQNNRDRDGHGPEFHKHMYRINKEAGTNITVFHSFHEEVKLYQQHWWRCDGPCQKRPPYFGMVKRAMDRPPGPNDFWWKEHQATCGGRYVKVREPPGFSEMKAKQTNKKGVSTSAGGRNDIRNFFPFHGKGNMLGNNTNNGSVTNKTFSKTSNEPQFPLLKSKTNNVTGFMDLLSKNMNAGQSHDKRKRNNSASTKSVSNANKRNGGLFPGNSPNKPLFGDKAHTTTSPNKANARAGTSVGMLANKGGGTLVVTAKGASNQKSFNGNLNVQNKLINNFVPFSGKGHILGAGGETKPTLTSEKSGTVTPNSVKNSALLEDSSYNLGNRTFLTEVTANKRHGSATENGRSKKIKSGSVLDLTSEFEEHSASSDNTVKCPVCNSDVREVDVNTHLDSCLGASFVNDGATATEECSGPSEADCREVKCPACNSEILKSDLCVHLEVCLGSVFGSSSVDDDYGMQDKSLVDMRSEYNVYPCPCCAALVKEAEMNAHLDHCLAGTLE